MFHVDLKLFMTFYQESNLLKEFTRLYTSSFVLSQPSYWTFEFWERSYQLCMQYALDSVKAVRGCAVWDTIVDIL